MSNTQKWDDLTEDYQRVILTPITSEGDQRFTQYAMDWGTTIGTLKAAWKFFGEQPKFTGTGQVVLKDLGGTNAQFFTLQAKAISFVDAVCEILDGIIENHNNLNDKHKKTNVSFSISGDGAKRKLIVEENSGGIKQENLDSVATLGDSGWGSLYGVGVFGVGLKKGLRKIARRHHLFTWHEDDTAPVEIEFSNQFWDDVGTMNSLTQATLCDGQALELMKKKKGSTIIHFSDFESYEEELEFTESFVQQIARYYHQWIENVSGEIRISFQQGTADAIWLHDHSVDLFSDKIIEQEFSYHPGFEPRQFTYTFKSGTIRKKNGKNVDSSVTINMKFGLTKKSEEAKAGVYVFGNDRFFHGPNRDLKFGFGTTGHFGKIKNYHAERKRFRVKVDVRAESPVDIPWHVGEKNGYNEASKTHHYIARMICCAASQYMVFDDVTKIPQTEHFTNIGIQSSDEKLGEAFFPNEGITSQASKNLLEKIKKFTPRTDLLENPVDYDKISEPGVSFGSWDLEDMRIIKNMCKKHKDSGNTNSYPDHDFVETLFNLYQPQSRSAPKKKKPTKKPSKNTSKKATKKSAKKPTSKLDPASVAKVKKANKIKIQKKNTNFQANLPSEALDLLMKECGFEDTPPRTVMVRLWCHYMLTKSSHNPKIHPKTGKNSIEDNKYFTQWVNKKPWTKKKK